MEQTNAKISRITGNETIETYLDNAATAPMYEQVINSVSRAMQNEYGNPSSLHAKGRAAKALLEDSRAVIADVIGAFPDEIFFTSGGTESNNLAIAGACSATEKRFGAGTIITTALEHPSVTKTIRGLKRSGWSVIYLDAVGGELDLEALRLALCETPDVRLVSVMAVQSELGYRFLIEEIVGICHETSAEICCCESRASAVHSASERAVPLVHTDAVQAFGKLALDAHALDVDLLSFCSHKIGGPKGVGALYVRRGTELYTTAFGGGQERGLRSGTEALPLIAGFAEAARIAKAGLPRAYENAQALRDRLVSELCHTYDGIVVNSRVDGSPFIVNFTVPKSDNRLVLERLSEAGIFLSTSMACASNHTTVPPGTWRKKHPLALQLAGVPPRHTQSTYRISFSDRTTSADIDRFLREFQGVMPSRRKKRTA